MCLEYLLFFVVTFLKYILAKKHFCKNLTILIIKFLSEDCFFICYLQEQKEP